MLKSDSITELAKALSKAQGEFPCAKKDSANPFFNSKYADLASIVDAIQAPLAKHGLSLVQCVVDAEHGVGIETILIHDSGEWLSSTYSMPVAKGDAQGVGSAITYGKRYAMAAICRLATEDDDGNAATKAAPIIAHKQTAQAKIHELRQEMATPKPTGEILAPNYGEFAKWPLGAVPRDGLIMYLDGATKAIDNPAKAKFRSANIALREAILAEIATRPEEEPPAPSEAHLDSPPLDEPAHTEAAGPNTPTLNPGNVCQQFVLCENIAEWAQVANAWQDESHLHSDEDRDRVKKAADLAKKNLGRK